MAADAALPGGSSVGAAAAAGRAADDPDICPVCHDELGQEMVSVGGDYCLLCVPTSLHASSWLPMCCIAPAPAPTALRPQVMLPCAHRVCCKCSLAMQERLPQFQPQVRGDGCPYCPALPSDYCAGSDRSTPRSSALHRRLHLPRAPCPRRRAGALRAPRAARRGWCESWSTLTRGSHRLSRCAGRDAQCVHAAWHASAACAHSGARTATALLIHDFGWCRGAAAAVGQTRRRLRSKVHTVPKCARAFAPAAASTSWQACRPTARTTRRPAAPRRLASSPGVPARACPCSAAGGGGAAPAVADSAGAHQPGAGLLHVEGCAGASQVRRGAAGGAARSAAWRAHTMPRLASRCIAPPPTLRLRPAPTHPPPPAATR